MTLLITEVHVNADLRDAAVLFLADRRITTKGRKSQYMHKIFQIPYLNAGVGFAGLAQVSASQFFPDWLNNFIRHQSDVQSIQEFAQRLQADLNQVVFKDYLRQNPSILHLCGANPDGYPELWHLRNCTMRGNDYFDCRPVYDLSEDFMSRNAARGGHNGVPSQVAGPFDVYYINGDVLPFHAAWPFLDQFADIMLSRADFKKLDTEQSLMTYAKWKMKVITTFYSAFAKEPIIGGPSDVFVLRPKQIPR